jgi:hypothetical protein
MRRLVFAALMCATLVNVALAQAGYGGGANSAPHNSSSAHSGSGNGHDNNSPPPPPPIPKCPDLAIASYGYVTAIPGQAPLATDEVAIQYEVRNAGTGSYIAAANGQMLTLSYFTPGGAHQVASVALPPSNGQAAAALASELTPQASWHGYMRATLTPADRRWPLHLKIQYGPAGLDIRGAANDCNLDNNEIILIRP